MVGQSVEAVVTTLLGMARRIVTADELEKMTPAEQDAHFEASIVRDLSTVSPEFRSRVRERVEQRAAEGKIPKQS